MVVQYHNHVDTKDHPSFADLVPQLNSSLHDYPIFSCVHVVSVKWTTASNLLVCAQAPSPSVLVAALEAIITDFKGGMKMRVKDIISNVKWSQVTLSHIFAGKGPNSPTHSPCDLHEELVAHNPNYVSLMIQQPSWVQNPESFKDGQISISFAFEDPDGSYAHQLIGSSLTAFGNLQCTVKAWITPKKTLQKA